jgi:hypothetical protein
MCARPRAGALLTAHSTADTEGDFRADLLIRLGSSGFVAVPTCAQEVMRRDDLGAPAASSSTDPPRAKDRTAAVTSSDSNPSRSATVAAASGWLLVVEVAHGLEQDRQGAWPVTTTGRGEGARREPALSNPPVDLGMTDRC